MQVEETLAASVNFAGAEGAVGGQGLGKEDEIAT